MSSSAIRLLAKRSCGVSAPRRRRYDAPAAIEPVIDSALAVARELEQIGEALERLERVVALIASAATAK